MTPGTTASTVESLDSSTSMELLASQAVGRVAFVLDNKPVVLPVNYAVDGWSVVFRTTYGSKLIAASAGAYVAFEADSIDRTSRTGWSVVARGSAEAVHDEELIGRLEALGLDTWAEGDRHQWVRIHLEELTGRRISRSD
jgi:uncharacterized protein